ncbi:MAG: FxsA family protein [Sphingomonadales bacterium]
MPLFFLILFILGVYAEYTVIINVRDEIGGLETFMAMIGTAVIGLWLVRLQGFDVYRKMNQTMQAGKSPVGEMLHGVLLLLAGFLLIIPGFISDAAGAILLVPPLRSVVISMGLWKYISKVEVKTTKTRTQSGVFEGEFKREDEPEEEPPAIDFENDNK